MWEASVLFTKRTLFSDMLKITNEGIIAQKNPNTEILMNLSHCKNVGYEGRIEF